MSDNDMRRLSPDFTALDPRDHACETCENKGSEPVVSIDGPDSRCFICARCLRGALALLRGLGLT